MASCCSLKAASGADTWTDWNYGFGGKKGRGHWEHEQELQQELKTVAAAVETCLTGSGGPDLSL